MNRIQELKAELIGAMNNIIDRDDAFKREKEEDERKKAEYQHLVGKCLHIPGGSYSKITSICNVHTDEYGENITFGCINFYFDNEDDSRIAYINTDGWDKEYMEDIERYIISVNDFNKALNECTDFIRRKIQSRETKRVIYFGTNGCPGHAAIPITGKFSDEEIKEVESIDSDNFYKIFDKKEFKIAKFKNYTILGFPVSPDDHRGGSKTVVMIEGEATEVDFIVLLNSVPFLKKQFNKLADMFKVNIWKE